ncbi:hypothetical protein ACFL4N_03810 [Thermodesulfobacteriota bacterium]
MTILAFENEPGKALKPLNLSEIMTILTIMTINRILLLLTIRKKERGEREERAMVEGRKKTVITVITVIKARPGATRESTFGEVGGLGRHFKRTFLRTAYLSGTSF